MREANYNLKMDNMVLHFSIHTDDENEMILDSDLDENDLELVAGPSMVAENVTISSEISKCCLL